MRRVQLAVSVAMIALAFFLWQRGAHRESVSGEISTRQSAARDSPGFADGALEPATTAPSPVALETRTLFTAEAPPAALPHESLILFGRTIDERDQPLAGLEVRIQGYKGWAEGVDVPRLSGEADVRGFELATDAEGRFRFDVPKPTVSIVELTIASDPFHDSARITFGSARKDSRPPIVSVGEDLGDIRLVATGAIRGVVRDPAKGAIAKARLSPGRGADGTSDATGAYTILHVPSGSWGITVRREGYLTQSGKPLEVRSGEYTDGIDFTLLPAPTLRGIVVDETGAPVEGAELMGAPQSTGEGARSRSAADGTFTMFLPQDEPYALGATKEGFDPRHFLERKQFFAAGTSDLRVEMVHSTNVRLLVVDAATEQPIERFGYQVLVYESRRSAIQSRGAPQPSKPETHAGGIALVGMRPGFDVILVSAPGFVDLRVDPDPDLPDEPIVARLSGGSAVIGRLVVGTAPGSERRLSLEGSNALLTNRFVDSDAQGRFRFDDVARGRYYLRLTQLGSMVLDGKRVVVDAALVDLGDVALTPGAILSGRVLVPPNRSAAGLKLHLDQTYESATATTNSEGRFRFEGLTAGVHKLMLDEVPDSIGVPPSMSVQLEAAEQRDVVYDVSASGMCWVSLTILHNSSPAANVDVELVSPAKGNASERQRRIDAAGRLCEVFRLGRTDAKGNVEGWAPARGPSRVSVQFDRDSRREHPGTELALELDARIEATVSFDNGQLVVILPDRVAFPEQGTLSAVLRHGKGQAAWQTLSTVVEPTRPRSFAFEQVVAGEFELEVTVTEIARNGGAKTVLLEISQPVVIRQGETTEARFP